MGDILDMNEKILDKIIKDLVKDFDDLSPEEKYIMLEEYFNNRDKYSIEDVLRRVG